MTDILQLISGCLVLAFLFHNFDVKSSSTNLRLDVYSLKGQRNEQNYLHLILSTHQKKKNFLWFNYVWQKAGQRWQPGSIVPRCLSGTQAFSSLQPKTLELIELDILNLHLLKKICWHSFSRQGKQCETLRNESEVSVVPFKMFFLLLASVSNIPLGVWN